MFDEFMKEYDDQSSEPETLTPEQELQQTLDELEQAIYEDSETISQITSKEEDLYMFTITDTSELTKLWIELKQTQDPSGGNGDGKGDGGDGQSGGGQAARDAAAKARAYMQKRAEDQQKRSEGEGQSPPNGGDQSNDPIDHDHGAPGEGDVESQEDVECKALLDLVGLENYKKIAAKIPVNQNTRVALKPIPTVNHRYEHNGLRRSVVAIPIKLDGKIVRVAYESEIRTVIVGE